MILTKKDMKKQLPCHHSSGRKGEQGSDNGHSVFFYKTVECVECENHLVVVDAKKTNFAGNCWKFSANIVSMASGEESARLGFKFLFAT